MKDDAEWPDSPPDTTKRATKRARPLEALTGMPTSQEGQLGPDHPSVMENSPTSDIRTGTNRLTHGAMYRDTGTQRRLDGL